MLLLLLFCQPRFKDYNDVKAFIENTMTSLYLNNPTSLNMQMKNNSRSEGAETHQSNARRGTGAIILA